MGVISAGIIIIISRPCRLIFLVADRAPPTSPTRSDLLIGAVIFSRTRHTAETVSFVAERGENGAHEIMRYLADKADGNGIQWKHAYAALHLCAQNWRESNASLMATRFSTPDAAICTLWCSLFHQRTLVPWRYLSCFYFCQSLHASPWRYFIRLQLAYRSRRGVIMPPPMNSISSCSWTLPLLPPWMDQSLWRLSINKEHGSHFFHLVNALL